MKKVSLMILFCLLGLQSSYAQGAGGLKENVAPRCPYGATSSSIMLTIATFSMTKRTPSTSSSPNPFLTGATFNATR